MVLNPFIEFLGVSKYVIGVVSWSMVVAWCVALAGTPAGGGYMLAAHPACWALQSTTEYHDALLTISGTMLSQPLYLL